MKATYTPTVPHKRLMLAATELCNGITIEARKIVAENPTGSNATWSGVFRKLIKQANDISMDELDRPAFSIFKEDGNSKLPFAAFSSMAVLDCGGRGDCEAWCYSKSAWRNPNAAGRQISNSMLLRSEVGRNLIRKAFSNLWMRASTHKTSPAMREELLRYSKSKDPRMILRLYVDGDFHSRDCLEFWMDLIKSRPDMDVYGYSKSWVEFLALKLTGYEFPSNYMLNLSGGSRHDRDPVMRELMLQLPITRGIFGAYHVDAKHMKSKAYQSKRNAGHAEYAKDVRRSAGKRVFVCAGKCGDCLPDGTHACGSERFRGIEIAIGIH